MSTWKPKIFQSIKKVMDLSLLFYSHLSVPVPGECQEVLSGNTSSKEAPSGENF